MIARAQPRVQHKYSPVSLRRKGVIQGGIAATSGTQCGGQRYESAGGMAEGRRLYLLPLEEAELSSPKNLE
jgi:hypothetical protein